MARTPPAHTGHTIGIQHVEQILMGARARGADVPALLQRAGISPALMDAPLSRVTQHQFAALIGALSHHLRDEFWGLCSRPVPIGSFTQAARLLIHCKTLGDALSLGLRHYRLLLGDFAPSLHVLGGQAQVAQVAQVALVPRGRPTPAVAYAQRAFSFMGYGLASWLVARRLPLLQVDYADSDARAKEAPRLFQAPVDFSAGCTGWRFEARWLDLPVVQTPHSLDDFLRDAPAGLLVKYRDQTSMTERIRRLLRRHLAEELPSLEAVGRQLALTPQTLRRRLAEEGKGYRALRDELQRDAAIEYLARADLSLLDIAQRLGFSEASTFHRAFKRWTGVAPGEYRTQRLRP